MASFCLVCLPSAWLHEKKYIITQLSEDPLLSRVGSGKLSVFILNRAGRIGWEQGTKILYLTFNKATKQLKQLYDRIGNALNNPTMKGA